jgi:hypothetical protein
MLNKRTVRAARARFVDALYKRYAITGFSLGMDIARTISERTGVPVAAIVVTPGKDSLTYGAARITTYKRFGAGVDENLRVVSIEEVD